MPEIRTYKNEVPGKAPHSLPEKPKHQAAEMAPRTFSRYLKSSANLRAN